MPRWTDFLCISKLRFCVKPILQMSHLNLFMPRWVHSLCLFSSILYRKPLLQISQFKGLNFSWTPFTCLLRLFLPKTLWQNSQVSSLLGGTSPTPFVFTLSVLFSEADLPTGIIFLGETTTLAFSKVICSVSFVGSVQPSIFNAATSSETVDKYSFSFCKVGAGNNTAKLFPHLGSFKQAAFSVCVSGR